MNFWPVLFYAPKNENQRKSHFWSLFEYVAFFSSFYLKKGQKMPISLKSHGVPWRYSRLLPEVALLKESHVTSQGYKS